VTSFVDQFSRLIVGWAISLHPTQAEVLAALRMAVTIDPARREFGGVAVLTPLGSRARVGGGLDRTKRRSHWGASPRGPRRIRRGRRGRKIERLNRTVEQELLQGLPARGGPRDVRGPRL